jgi:hypothetical protein
MQRRSVVSHSNGRRSRSSLPISDLILGRLLLQTSRRHMELEGCQPCSSARRDSAALWSLVHPRGFHNEPLSRFQVRNSPDELERFPQYRTNRDLQSSLFYIATSLPISALTESLKDYPCRNTIEGSTTDSKKPQISTATSLHRKPEESCTPFGRAQHRDAQYRTEPAQRRTSAIPDWD